MDYSGGVREWYYEVEGNQWRTYSGLVTGKKAVSGWVTCEGKNLGKANATNPEEQALLEAEAELNKKLIRDYRFTVEELEFVPVQPMLAQDFNKQKEIIFPVYAQPKLDGIRALISRRGAFTRQFKQHHNVEHILEALAPVFEKYPDLILDGELYNHELRDDFNEIASIVRKQKATEEDRIKARELIQFHCYDMVSTKDFSIRTVELASILNDCDRTIIVDVYTAMASSQEKLDELYHGSLIRGYEGQMVRDTHGEYECGKRSKLLLKRKEFYTEEFELLDIQAGRGNWDGFAKTATVRLDPNRECGTGMRGTRSFLKEKLDNKSNYIGGSVTVRYFTPTPDGMLRFPVIIDWHPHGRND